MSGTRDLDELPDEVFVALGRRGMEGIPLKECTYECGGKDLILMDVTTTPQKLSGKGLETQVEDWTVRCSTCNRMFVIRCSSRFVDNEKMDTMVSIFDDRGNDLGWLGSY